MNKLIITADDYGMSLAVNDAINQGITAGIITSTNVMTNMPYYQDAKYLRKNTNVSVGVHWTLSCGKPVLSPELIPTLVDDAGCFFDYPTFRSRYRKKLIDNEDIKKELVAQYELFVKVCGKADYWNTHQNVHVDFNIYKLFVDLAVSLGIEKMRSHQRIYVPGCNSEAVQPLKWRIIEPIKSRLLDIWQNNAHRKGLSSPEGLIVCLNNTDVNRLEYTFSNIKWKKKEIGEFVIHPAVECDSPYFGKIVDQRITEYKNFSSLDTKKIIENNNILLVNYSKV